MTEPRAGTVSLYTLCARTFLVHVCPPGGAILKNVSYSGTVRCLTGFRQFLKDGLLDWILSLRNEQVNNEQLVREGVCNLPLPVLNHLQGDGLYTRSSCLLAGGLLKE